MAVAIDTSRLALDVIPAMQRELDRVIGDGRRFHIYRVSVYATILSQVSDISRQVYFSGDSAIIEIYSNAKQEALDWQADPGNDLDDAEVFHHLRQQAATVPLLSSVISQSGRGNAATTLIGSAVPSSTNTRTLGRPVSSFHCYSYRTSSVSLGVPIRHVVRVSAESDLTALFPDDVQDPCDLFHSIWDPSPLIVWAGPGRDNQLVSGQVQVDMLDLFSCRPLISRPSKRRRTAFNQFMQVSHSPGLENLSRGDPLSHEKRYNGVRYRPERKLWAAEMRPPKHKIKQNFGNFKSEDESARAVDAAFHHYGRPYLLNFPHTSLQFFSTRPAAPAGLDEKAKVKFVKEEANSLLAAIAAPSPLHSTPTNSLPILDLSASPRRGPSGPFRSHSEISSPFRYSGSDGVDDAVSQPQPWTLLDSIRDISTAGLLTDLETLNSVQIAEQGWDRTETLAPQPNVVNPSRYESQSIWLDSIIRSSHAPTYPRSPSPSHFEEEIAYALLEHQSI